MCPSYWRYSNTCSRKCVFSCLAGDCFPVRLWEGISCLLAMNCFSKVIYRQGDQLWSIAQGNWCCINLTKLTFMKDLQNYHGLSSCFHHPELHYLSPALAFPLVTHLLIMPKWFDQRRWPKKPIFYFLCRTYVSVILSCNAGASSQSLCVLSCIQLMTWDFHQLIAATKCFSGLWTLCICGAAEQQTDGSDQCGNQMHGNLCGNK